MGNLDTRYMPYYAVLIRSGIWAMMLKAGFVTKAKPLLLLEITIMPGRFVGNQKRGNGHILRSRAGRLLALIKLLEQEERFTAGSIARIFGVTERTLYRDLSCLKQLDVPIYHDGGRYRLDREQWAVWSTNELRQAVDQAMAEDAHSASSSSGIDGSRMER